MSRIQKAGTGRKASRTSKPPVRKTTGSGEPKKKTWKMKVYVAMGENGEPAVYYPNTEFPWMNLSPERATKDAASRAGKRKVKVLQGDLELILHQED